ncbi:MAG: tRNA (adenosine(37)-N6)-threonylcarbamoyltransferase complex transferase subunit TsaD [Saprospiraceae bacterium]
MSIKILGIESSCDDSSMAILENGHILTNLTYTQKIHEKYGGVVPEWASRKHMEAIIPLLNETLEAASVRLEDLNAIAVTQGPGLMGSLMVGIGFAKGLSLGLNIPLIAVNHLEAHITSLMIDDPKPEFPFLCLTISGGHTQLVLVYDIGQMELLGTTIDDAAGEAFDKIGKHLGLPFPGGPYLDKLARTGKPIYKFPITKLDNYNYSFSGIKTSVLYFLRKKLAENPNFIQENLEDLCASVQHTIIEILCIQLIEVSKKYKIKNIGIAGGVSANSGLRNKLQELQMEYGWNVYFPQFQYCTDNAAMIAMVAYFKFIKNEFSKDNFEAMARYPLVNL